MGVAHCPDAFGGLAGGGAGSDGKGGGGVLTCSCSEVECILRIGGMVSEKTNEFRTVGELTLMSFFSGARYSLSSSATVQQW